MKISDDKKLKDLQKDFQSVFPYLKIEFFRMGHKKGELSDEHSRLNPDLSVNDVRYSHNAGFLTLCGELTTADFERKMQELFALNVQVYRKEYQTWQQTWITDNWTLHEQNRKGSINGDKGKPMAEKNSFAVMMGSWFLL